MSPSVATLGRPIAAVADVSNTRLGAAVREHDQPAAAAFGRTAELVEDGLLLLLIVLMVPVSILLIGTPIALVLRAVLEIARRF